MQSTNIWSPTLAIKPRGSHTSVLLLLLLFGNFCCCLLEQRAPSRHLQQVSADPPRALESMQQAGLLLSEDLLAQGFKGASPRAGRMWGTLAQKLSTPGSNVTVVTYGGSVTAGHLAGSPEGSWVEHLTSWLQTAFPDVTFGVLNLARNSTDNAAAAVCWAQYAPADADLVIVEYSVNNCNYGTCTGITQQLVYSYELLLRRLMLRAPTAAFLALAAFRFSDFAAVDPATGSQMTVPNPFFNAGEDVHAGIARRYGVPMMSVRDTLHDLLWDDAALQAATGFTRQQLLMDDVHPATNGNKVYAAHVAYGITQMLLPQLTALAAGQDGSTLQQQQQQLPPPMSPTAARQGDALPFCAEGELLRQYLVESGNLLAASGPFDVFGSGFWAAPALNGSWIASLPHSGGSGGDGSGISNSSSDSSSSTDSSSGSGGDAGGVGGDTAGGVGGDTTGGDTAGGDTAGGDTAGGAGSDNAGGGSAGGAGSGSSEGDNRGHGNDDSSDEHVGDSDRSVGNSSSSMAGEGLGTGGSLPHSSSSSAAGGSAADANSSSRSSTGNRKLLQAHASGKGSSWWYVQGSLLPDNGAAQGNAAPDSSSSSSQGDGRPRIPLPANDSSNSNSSSSSSSSNSTDGLPASPAPDSSSNSSNGSSSSSRGSQLPSPEPGKVTDSNSSSMLLSPAPEDSSSSNSNSSNLSPSPAPEFSNSNSSNGSDAIPSSPAPDNNSSSGSNSTGSVPPSPAPDNNSSSGSNSTGTEPSSPAPDNNSSSGSNSTDLASPSPTPSPTPSPAPVTAWAWNDAPFKRIAGNPNSHNLGLQGRGLGAYLELNLNTEAPPGAATVPSLFQGSGSDVEQQQFQLAQQQLQQQLPRRLLVVLFNRGVSEPRSKMGVAQLTCVSGCECAPMWLVGYKQGDTAAALRINSTQVSQHPECIVRITITHATTPGATPTAAELGAGGSSVWFKLNGIAVVSYTDELPRTSLDDSLARSCEASTRGLDSLV